MYNPNPFGVFYVALATPGTVTLTVGIEYGQRRKRWGGISNQGTGTLNIINSMVNNNLSTTSGGGLFNVSTGTINLTRSTVSGNSSPGGGGGILNNGAGAVNITDSTVANNSAFFPGASGVVFVIPALGQSLLATALLAVTLLPATGAVGALLTRPWGR